MSFEIFRIQKLKSHHAVARSLTHSFRDQETKNADSTRTPDNTHYKTQDRKQALQAYNSLIQKAAAATKSGKIRKNAVVAVEFLITASPEWMHNTSRQNQDRYFEEALAWLEKKHGAENVFHAGVHRDESTPHMYAYVTPRDETGKLNCRKFYGGIPSLSKLQDDFHLGVGRGFGLKRGVKGSKAKHTRISQFYKNINDAAEKKISAKEVNPIVLKKGILTKKLESDNQISERLNEKVQVWQDKAVAYEKTKVRNKILETERISLERAIEKLKKEKEEIEKKTSFLTDQEIEYLKNKKQSEKNIEIKDNNKILNNLIFGINKEKNKNDEKYNNDLR